MAAKDNDMWRRRKRSTCLQLPEDLSACCSPIVSIEQFSERRPFDGFLLQALRSYSKRKSTASRSRCGVSASLSESIRYGNGLEKQPM